MGIFYPALVGTGVTVIAADGHLIRARFCINRYKLGRIVDSYP